MNNAEQIIASAAISCPSNQNIRIICPKCGPERRHKDPTLSLTVNGKDVLYNCHHCGYDGAVSATNPLDKYRNKVSQIPTRLNQLTKLPPVANNNDDTIKAFFKRRGIDLTDISDLPITTGTKWFPAIKQEKPAVGFVYGPKDAPNAVKWRPADGEKTFVQDGAARELYGLDQYTDEDTTITLVEGESDSIALRSIGIKSVSVPNGAPMKVSQGRVRPEEDSKFGYLWNAKDQFDRAEKVILAVDSDPPGEALAEEIARRVGRGKCYRVRYPTGAKDPTDVIVQHGAEKMRELVKNAEPVPLAGVYGAEEYHERLLEVYADGFIRGESTGFPSIDELCTVATGRLYVVTGFAGAGKSEWLDQIMVNIARKSGWRWAVASFENQPVEHVIKFSEKIIGKPFFEGAVPRITREELDEAYDFVREHFVFLQNHGGSMDTAQDIIDRCKQAVMRLGVRGLVVDPYNAIRLDADKEHKSIEIMLSQFRAFAQAYDIAVWIVAHPTKMHMREDGTYPVPKGMQISGSYAWTTKADTGLTIHRPNSQHIVQIHSWKARSKYLGKLGSATLRYDKATGRYFEADNYQRSEELW